MKQRLITMLVVCLASALVFVLGFTTGRTTQLEQEPLTYTVTDKAEDGERFYIQTWIEVSSEKYIGLDIGDEFEQ